MNRFDYTVVLVGVTVLGSCSGAGDVPDPPEPASEFVVIDSGVQREALRFSPLPPTPPDPTNRVAEDPRAILLGRWLFHDPRLSQGGEISCATCHDPEKDWTDEKTTAAGLGPIPRHTPTLWNAGHYRWFFWDGRADSLWAQALQPWEHPDEHGGSRVQFAHLIAEDPDLRPLYEAVFGALPALEDRKRFPRHGRSRSVPGIEGLHRAWDRLSVEDQALIDSIFVDLGKSMAAFVRTIRSDASPFDHFVRGLRTGDVTDLQALSPSAQRGFALFVGRAECDRCHSGPMFSDLEFHSVRAPPGPGGDPDDLGRFTGLPLLQASPFNGAGEYSDDPEKGGRRLRFLIRRAHNAGEFKTPSLRNVARTAPYMHHGQYATLEQVLEHYSTMEDAVEPPELHHPGEIVPRETLLLPLEFTPEEVTDLIAFLESLNDSRVDPRLHGPPSREELREVLQADSSEAPEDSSP